MWTRFVRLRRREGTAIIFAYRTIFGRTPDYPWSCVMMLIVIIVVFLLLFGGGYHGYRREYYGGGGFGLIGTVLIVLFLLMLFGGPRFGWYSY